MHNELAYAYIALMFAVLAPVAAVLWVMADAAAIRRLEVLTCGESDCQPPVWGIAVFLLPVVAIPMYVRFRRLRIEQLDRLAAATALVAD